MTFATPEEVSAAILEIRDLIRLLAEPAVAERDRKQREELRNLVGSSKSKRQSVLLMDGTRNQQSIRTQTGVNQGHLSTLVKELGQANLLIEDPKLPKLAISLPVNFFESDK